MQVQLSKYSLILHILSHSRANSIFSLINATGASLIWKLQGLTLIGGQRLKERDTYFKVIIIKFQEFVIISRK